MPRHRYLLIIERDEDGKYVASVPELPGCHTQADDLSELDARIKEAIRLYLEVSGHRGNGTNVLVGVHEVEVAL